MFIEYIVGTRHCAQSREMEERATVLVVTGCCRRPMWGFTGVLRKEADPPLQKWVAAGARSCGEWLLWKSPLRKPFPDSFPTLGSLELLQPISANIGILL